MSKLRLHSGPYVVAVLSTPEGLRGGSPPVGDIVEVRLDKTGRPADWLARCQAIEAGGKPVLLTVRLRAEGGDWIEDDEARLKIYEAALPVLAAVDVELSSAICGAVASRARELDKVCLVSHHDFQKTPPLDELESIVQRARQNGAVAKIATMIRRPADADLLRALISRRGDQPLCVIGMGDEWKQTRVSFPQLGSCLTYGYLDQPTAPGQWSAVELIRQLRETK
jgi:3-dehydroquinate dehydratase-1